MADLDRLCDDIGVDTIETGAAVAVYMDSGGLEWGDAKGTKALLREIAEDTEVGRMIGSGAVATGRRQKHHRVPAVKGQAIPAWDPRPLHAAGVTYCTSAMGADHTAGLVVEPGQSVDEIARASQEAQIVNSAIDTSGFCQVPRHQPRRNRHLLQPLLRRVDQPRAGRRSRLEESRGRVGVQPTRRLHRRRRHHGRLHGGGRDRRRDEVRLGRTARGHGDRVRALRAGPKSSTPRAQAEARRPLRANALELVLRQR